MAEDATPRPFSGELMAGAGGRRGVTGDDIVDAEFETLPAGRPGVARASPSPQVNPVQGMETLTRRPAAIAASRGGPVFWICGIALAACAFWVSGGHALVRSAVPESEAVRSISGAPLVIVDVGHRVIQRGGKPVLQVDGAAVNEGEHPWMLPPVEIAVTDDVGRVTRYKLGTSDRPLQPGGRFDFSSRLEAPKDAVKSVSVSFSEDSADAGRQGQGH